MFRSSTRRKVGSAFLSPFQQVLQDSALQPDWSLQTDNIEVVIFLGVEGTHVCNPLFLLEQTRLKALSSFLEATCPPGPRRPKGMQQTKHKRGQRYPLQDVHIPTCAPRFPFILALNSVLPPILCCSCLL